MGSTVMAATPPRTMTFGTVSFTNSLGTVATTFPVPMPNASYTVYYYLVSGGSLGFATTSNQTAAGFTTTLAVSVSATLGWIAIMN